MELNWNWNKISFLLLCIVTVGFASVEIFFITCLPAFAIDKYVIISITCFQLSLTKKKTYRQTFFGSLAHGISIAKRIWTVTFLSRNNEEFIQKRFLQKSLMSVPFHCSQELWKFFQKEYYNVILSTRQNISMKANTEKVRSSLSSAAVWIIFKIINHVNPPTTST